MVHSRGSSSDYIAEVLENHIVESHSTTASLSLSKRKKKPQKKKTPPPPNPDASPLPPLGQSGERGECHAPTGMMGKHMTSSCLMGICSRDKVCALVWRK